MPESNCVPILDTDFDMNTCFAWLGTGAFVSRSRVLQTLESATLVKPSLEAGASRILGPLASDELAMLDNSFTIFQNVAPYVLSSGLVPMPQPMAFTAGDGTAGDRRNELYMASWHRHSTNLPPYTDAICHRCSAEGPG